MANNQLLVNMNEVNRSMPSLPDSPPIDGDSDGYIAINGDNESDLSKRTSIEDRIKRRAKRPSKFVIDVKAAVNGVSANGHLVTNGHSMDDLNNSDVVSPKINNGIPNPLKKFTKNSRRSRGRFGRGLPKKGMSY